MQRKTTASRIHSKPRSDLGVTVLHEKAAGLRRVNSLPESGSLRPMPIEAAVEGIGLAWDGFLGDSDSR